MEEILSVDECFQKVSLFKDFGTGLHINAYTVHKLVFECVKVKLSLLRKLFEQSNLRVCLINN